MTTELTLPEAIETLPKTWKNIEFRQLQSLASLSTLSLWCRGIRLFADAQLTATTRFSIAREHFEVERKARALEKGPAQTALLNEAEWLGFFHAEAGSRYEEDMAVLRKINIELASRTDLVGKAVRK